MSKFRTPQRRQTRQRSGFNVAAGKKGSTCKIELSQRIQPAADKIVIVASVERLIVPELFARKMGIIGTGFYIRPEAACSYSCTLTWTISGKSHSKSLAVSKLDAGLWQRVGLIDEIAPITKQTTIENLEFSIAIDTFQPVNIFGVISGAITYEYFIEHDVYKAFQTKTSLFIPEILYLDPVDDACPYSVSVGTLLGPGHPVVCKSCNRCSRYLPIQVEEELNTISYSNHCVSRAPCKHKSFSTYKVESGATSLPVYAASGLITTHFGHQLECVACKKFYVNKPLNPKRNSTQHREDSLRRRALEVLVAELLGKDWIYHAHRMATGTEFDVHIWEKFGRKCFKCDEELPAPNDMDLDHTLPLAYLWPLDTTATCLCPKCNSKKSDRFPVDFYRSDKLEELSKKTGIQLETLKSRPINKDAVDRLFARVEWFFDIFLAMPDYQKVREGKRASDLIVHSIHNVLRASGYVDDLVELYRERTGRLPPTVTIS